MTTLSNILSRETPWIEEPGTVNPWRSQKSQSDLVTKQQVFLVTSSTVMLIICMALCPCESWHLVIA